MPPICAKCGKSHEPEKTCNPKFPGYTLYDGEEFEVLTGPFKGQRGKLVAKTEEERLSKIENRKVHFYLIEFKVKGSGARFSMFVTYDPFALRWIDPRIVERKSLFKKNVMRYLKSIRANEHFILYCNYMEHISVVTDIEIAKTLDDFIIVEE